MNFASDNTAGVAPAILNAIAQANDGYALGYGGAAGTARVEQRFAELFEHAAAVHVDGARFANALVRTNVTLAEITWRAGVDVLSFGATKGGALAAEAVIFFDPARTRGMPERRKRGGQLLSKHRFLAAQLDAYLKDDLWLELARHANRMADRLAEGLSAAGITPAWPVE